MLFDSNGVGDFFMFFYKKSLPILNSNKCTPIQKPVVSFSLQKYVIAKERSDMHNSIFFTLNSYLQ